MLNESFLNSCYGLVFSQKSRDVDKSVYSDLLYFLNFAEKRTMEEIPVSWKLKFEVLRKICEHKIKGGSMEELILSVDFSEVNSQLMDFIVYKQNEVLSDQELDNSTAIISKLVTLCNMNRHLIDFREYYDKVMDGSYDFIDELIEEWCGLIKSASSEVADYELKSRTELVSSFNTSSDGVDAIIREIRKKHSRKNIIPSGIPELDRDFLNGGFQPSRLSMFGGTSGVGKSLLLLNMAIRAAQNTMIRKAPFALLGEPLLDEPPESVYLYVTMENYVYETWTRMYCAMFGKTKNEMLQGLYNGEVTPRTISEEIRSFLAPHRSSLQIEYFPANSISPATIGGLIRKYNEEPRVRSVKAVYVDYLDLLLPDEQREFYRLDLGEITSSLKTLAANFEIPIITATQLNREAYRTSKKGEIGSAMISESMQKLFIADFSAMMFRDDVGKKDVADRPTDDIPKKVALKVDKNRDGKTGCTHIYFDYPRSRFITQEEFVEEYEKLMAI